MHLDDAPQVQQLCNGKHLVISGRVQGVWYRASMKSQAEQLGVTGWCQNLPSGDVEAAIFGSMQALEKMIAWSRQGPEHAKVSSVMVEDMPMTDTSCNSATFEIRS